VLLDLVDLLELLTTFFFVVDFGDVVFLVDLRGVLVVVLSPKGIFKKSHSLLFTLVLLLDLLVVLTLDFDETRLVLGVLVVDLPCLITVGVFEVKRLVVVDVVFPSLVVVGVLDGTRLVVVFLVSLDTFFTDFLVVFFELLIFLGLKLILN
jgi:hypothetical protein